MWPTNTVGAAHSIPFFINSESNASFILCADKYIYVYPGPACIAVECI